MKQAFLVRLAVSVLAGCFVGLLIDPEGVELFLDYTVTHLRR
jgi:hypothetical protein